MGTISCIVNGQKGRGGTTYGNAATYMGYDGTYREYVLSFTTEAFTGVSKSITFKIKLANTSVSSGTTGTFRYALLSSDANAMGSSTTTNLYYNTADNVVDENQITKGTVEFADIKLETQKILEIKTTALKPNTTYYLVLWAVSTTPRLITTVHLAQTHEVSLAYEEGLVYIYGCSSYENNSDDSIAIIGQSHRSNGYSNGVAYAGYFDSLYYDYVMKFELPSFTGISDSITFNIKMYNSDYTTSTLRYAICTSDANRSLYKNHGNAVYDDEYQIVSGVVTFENVNQDTVKSFTVMTGGLIPSETHYLFLWSYAASTLMNVSIRDISQHTISINYNTPSDGTTEAFSYEPYIVYIDNGTGWDMYIPYIDNGTSWDICC